MHMMLSLSFREVAIITGSLEKWPKETIDCLVRLEELLGSLRTGNPFKIEEDEMSGLKDGGLSISISHETTIHPEIRIFLIIMFDGEQFFSKFRNESLILRNKGLIYLSSIGSGAPYRCESLKTRHNV